VYRLELLPGSACQTGEDGGPCALFSIKLYPYPQDPVFGFFSGKERELVMSRAFDHTHTPTFEAQDKIAPDLFTVGTLTASADRSDRVVRFCLESMEPLRTIDHTSGAPSGKVTRNLPGMQAAYPLFDVLICLLSFAKRQPPSRMQIVGSTGVEFHLTENRVRCEPSEEITGYRVSVYYPGAEDSQKNRHPTLKKPASNPGQCRVFCDEAFPGGRFHPPCNGEKPVIPLNEKWWSIAGAHHHSHLASACGCSKESIGNEKNRRSSLPGESFPGFRFLQKNPGHRN
jgi:hypothetical protein